MKPTRGQRISRRELQRLLLVAPAPLAAALLAGRLSGIALSQESSASPEATPSLAPTPECGDDDDLELTIPQTAGPFFTPDSPERTSLLEEGVLGTELHVSGYIYSTSCQPVPGAFIDFWQADDDGVYDNKGYRLRGHQFADDEGRYELTTILPGIYPGRTRHIHVRVQAPNGPVLTTQIYFPDDPGNASDRIFDERLVVDLSSEDDRLAAFFTFVLQDGE